MEKPPPEPPLPTVEGGRTFARPPARSPRSNPAGLREPFHMPIPPSRHGGRLQVTLFGGPSLLCDSKELPLSPYQHAALGLICGHGPGGISRSQLVGLLWEDQHNAEARRRLSQLLYVITCRVGSELFVRQRDQLTRNAQTTECDLEEFESLLQGGSVKEAAALIERGFLPGLLNPPPESTTIGRAHVNLLSERDSASPPQRHGPKQRAQRIGVAPGTQQKPSSPSIQIARSICDASSRHERCAGRQRKRKPHIERG